MPSQPERRGADGRTDADDTSWSERLRWWWYATTADELAEGLFTGVLVVASVTALVYLSAGFVGGGDDAPPLAVRSHAEGVPADGATLTPIDVPEDPTTPIAGGGGGGGGVGGGAGAAVGNPCRTDQPLTGAVKRNTGLHMFSFWQDRHTGCGARPRRQRGR